MEVSQKIVDLDAKARFERDGYLVIDFGLSEAFIDEIVAKTLEQYDPEFLRNPTFTTRLQDSWKTIDEIRQLAVHPLALAALKDLWGRTPRPFQTLNFPIGTSQRVHSDTIHFNCMPKGFMCGVWVAFEDIDESNGPLVYYPGSHLLPEYSMQDFGLDVGYDYYPQYEQRIEDLLEIEGLQPELGIVKKGQAIIWHANLLHGGYAHQDLARSRHSQVTHYYFKGCKYYTPMESSAAKVMHRQPDWISTTPYRPPNTLQSYIRKFQRDYNLSG